MEDYVKELGCLGFTMRLKRLSDAMIHDGRKMYKELGLDIEPNFYVVFRLLKKEGSLSVTEIADRINLSHPSVITLTNKMIRLGYLESSTSTEDQRKRELELSAKAWEILPQLEKIWDAGERGIIKALEDTQFMERFEEIERRFFEKGFKERTLNELNQ